MSRERTALAALDRASTKFRHNLMTDSRGVYAIINLDAYDPQLGVHTNCDLMMLRVSSTDTVKGLAKMIDEKWGDND